MATIRVTNDYPSNQEHTEREGDMLGHQRGNRESEGVDNERDDQSADGDGGGEQPARESDNPRK